MKVSILPRYIIKEISQYFFGALFAFTTMLLALNVLKFASLIINKGVEASQIAMVFISLIPTFLEIAIPMAALLGVMLAFARLSGDSEIIVMRASGISILTLARPVCLFGILVTLLSLFVSLVGRPWGYDRLSKTLFSIASSSSVAALDEGVFSKLGDLTIYTAEVDHQTGSMKKVMLDDRRLKDDRKIVFAKSGAIFSDPVTRRIIIRLVDGEVHELVEGKYSVTHFSTNSSVLDSQELFSDDASKKGKQLNAMSGDELEQMRKAYNDLLGVVSSAGAPKEEIELPLGQKMAPSQANPKELLKRINRTKIEAERRWSMPLASLVLALMGMTLGVQPPRTQRTWGIGLSAAFGMGVFVIYYGFLSVGIALSEAGQIPPLLALWLPNVAVAALGCWALWQVGTERWQSVAQRFDISFSNFKNKFAA